MRRRWYRLLLHAFPPAWRERYGEDLLRTLEEDASNSALRPAVDLVHSGLLERVRGFRRLTWSGIRFARGRALALGVGLMVAATAFSLLTASVDVGTARVNGVVGRSWRGAYDLLVLPAASLQSAGTSEHPIEHANYLSTSAGGITFAQYSRIARLPGVAVAAPLAVVGYVLETVSISLDLGSVAGTSGARVLTVTSRFSADEGLSTYPAQSDGYVYLTPNHLSSIQFATVVGPVETLPDGRKVDVCDLGSNRVVQTSPFQSVSQSQLNDECYSRRGLHPSEVVASLDWSFPVLVAAIDPTAENELTGLRRAVVSGRYLSEADRPTPLGPSKVVPVLASTVSFDGDVDRVTVRQLSPVAVGVVRSGRQAIAMQLALDKLPGKTVMSTTISGAQAWRQLLGQLDFPLSANRVAVAQILGQYWTVSPVRYRRGPSGSLEAVAVRNPDSDWLAATNIDNAEYVSAPPAAADTALRKLSENLEATTTGGAAVLMRRIGEFDPYRLEGFAAGSDSPLASYRAPLLTGAGATSRAALGGQPLLPDGNLAGYAQQPPLLLTTLAGAETIEKDAADSPVAARQAAAPIGSIRVRVSGLRGSVPEKLQKIAAIGDEIQKATGLQVIVTAGASPEDVTIVLPPGLFGRPTLTVSEPWTAIMVAFVILREADRESLALFVLILVVCGLFLAGAALAGVRGRREEIGILRALGWRRLQVFALVLGEVALLGVVAGLAGAALSLMLIRGLGLQVPLWRAALVLPVATLLAVLSGMAPAWLAARIEPAGALAPAARAPRRRAWPVRSVTSLAITGVARSLGRNALAGAALAAGVAALSILLAAQVSFASSIGDSALAGLVTASARGADVFSALLAVGLGATAVADVTYLNLRERRPELASLAASGWSQTDVGRLLVTEALVVAGLASFLGAAAGLLAASYVFGLSGLVVAGAAAAAAGGTLVALGGTIAVLVATARQPLAAVLAADE